MGLLELLPELFGRVVMHLATDAGVVETWKHRKVCRKCTILPAIDRPNILDGQADTSKGTFRTVVEFEVLAKQQTRAFLRKMIPNGRNILKNYTVLYLRYRMKAH